MEQGAERLEQAVARCITTSLVTVDPGATLFQASALMAEHGIGLLVVVDDDVVVGVLSERDVVRALADGDDPTTVVVGDRGSAEVVTIDVEASLADALERMLETDVRHLLATDGGGSPAGVLSMRDVMLELAVR